jgi:type IV secretory pathway VirB2 component (pilin)
MKIKKYTLFVFVLFIFLIVPFAAQAQATYSQNINIPNPFNCGGTSPCTLLSLINAILTNIILPIGAVAAVIFIIIAGFKYIQAQGNPAKIQEAHKRLLWTLIGVGVLLGAAGISAVLQATVRQFLN